MKHFVAAVLIFLGFNLQAKADNAVGAVLGDPSGLSARFGLDSFHSIEGALAYSVSGYKGFHMHATYLWDRARAFKTSGDPLYMYYGLGARFISINDGKYDGDLAIGPRAPLGLIYYFENPDLEVFGELSVALDVAPKTDVDLDVGIGVRVRF